MLVAICVGFAASPRSAAAAIVQLQLAGTGTFRITYAGTADEVNSLLVSKAGGFYVFHDTAGVTGTIGSCEDVNPPDESRCSDVGVVEIRISLTGGNDDLTIAPSASPAPPPPGAPRIIAFGGSGTDTLIGGPGRETLDGGDGNDTSVDGGGGDDEVTGGPGDDTVAGGDGNDRLDFPGADPLEDQSAGVDVLDGGAGDDQLNGGPDRSPQEGDSLRGGSGTDTADYSQRAASLAIALDGVPNDGQAGEGDNVAADVENVIGGSGRDTLIGSGAANVLDGRDADDTLLGGSADDRLEGGAGNDTLMGEDGGDILTSGDGDDALGGGNGNDVLSSGGGSDALTGDDGNDMLAGGAGSDRLDGGPGDDRLNGAEVGLVGGDGDDRLNGGGGADVLLGGPGNDRLDGGLGPDGISGEEGTDTLTYEDRTNAVTVRLNGLADDGEKGEGDNVGADVEIVLGGAVWDTLTGDRNPNTLIGGSGEDLITGNDGPDVLQGGDATDLIRARDGSADSVDCGNDGDLAIVDSRDSVLHCKWIDRGGRRLLVAHWAFVRPGRTQFGLELPRGQRFYRLGDAMKVPIGSTIDARAGEIRLATAKNRTGARQQISVSRGVFSVRQQAGTQPVTELRLVANLEVCSRSATIRRVPKDQPVGRLDMRTDKGKRAKYQVRGKHSIGAPRGTSWVTEERCDGTFTRVRSGTVKVRDLERKRTMTLHAGDTYLARPR
jgi:Ca2+-binding RTX toxin-like protein